MVRSFKAQGKLEVWQNLRPREDGERLQTMEATMQQHGAALAELLHSMKDQQQMITGMAQRFSVPPVAGEISSHDCILHPASTSFQTCL